MRKAILLFVIFMPMLLSCSSDEPNLSEEQPISDNANLEFNQWVYGEMNRQYLWREDLPDSLDCDYSLAPRDFFKSLLSSKDRFSYFTTNPNYNHGRSENGNDEYGFAYQPLMDAEGNVVLEILYIVSPHLKQYGFKRGDLVRLSGESKTEYTINKVFIENGNIGDSDEKYQVSKNNIGEKSTVLVDSVYIIGEKRIGYLCYLEYDETKDLDAPLKRFKSEQITDLILDLRYNPGGYVSTCRFLCNCIVTESAYGKLFQQCSYNDILSAQYLNETGDSKKYSFFEFPDKMYGEMLGVELIPLNLSHLYVITSTHTASASEATIVCLDSYMPVTLIGEQTCGKGVGSWTIYNARFYDAIQPITMRYYNADGFSTPDEGLPPDIFVSDAYLTGKLEIGNVNERLLSTTLEYITGSASDGIDNSRADGAVALESLLTPVGEPSFVTAFRTKHCN